MLSALLRIVSLATGTGFLLAGLVLTLLAVYSLFILWRRFQYRHIPGPPLKSFFLGNCGELADRMDNYRVHIRWAQQYGPVFKLCLFHKVIIFAASPELARELLTNSKYPKAQELYEQFRKILGVPFLGNGLVTNLDYADWRVHRQAMNPAFHRSFLEGLISVFNETADSLIGDLNRVADSGQVVRILDFFHETTSAVIAKVAFSYDIKSEYNPKRNFAHDLYTCMKVRTEMSFDITMQYNPWKRDKVRECKEAIVSIRDTVHGILVKRLSAMRSGADVPRDILTIMLQNLSEHCTLEQLGDEMVTLFIAGQETTANTLSFLLMELGRHPEVLESVQGEVARLIGNKEFIEQADLDRLDWVTAVIKETLRMYPVSGGTSREMPKEGVMGGYWLPQKTNIIISFFAIQYLFHENGFDFKPEWWLADNHARTDFNFMPFSLGQRSCVGRQFAYMEAKILVCKFFQHFTFRLDPTQSFAVEEAATQRPADGVRITVSMLN